MTSAQNPILEVDIELTEQEAVMLFLLCRLGVMNMNEGKDLDIKLADQVYYKLKRAIGAARVEGRRQRRKSAR